MTERSQWEKMKKSGWPEIEGRVKKLGRTFFDKDDQILYMNWTCSGVEFVFRGTVLMVEFTAGCGAEDEVVFVPCYTSGFVKENLDDTNLVSSVQEKRKTWPAAAVFLDDEEKPFRQFTVDENARTELLFFSGKEETHRIRLVKLTENLKSFLGIKCFWAEGEFEPFAREGCRPKCIEFVGDSITCGFGNMTNEKDRLFYSEDENGWLSHASLAGRMLGMDFRIIASSGICAAKRKALPHPYSMEELYEYTDRPYQDMMQVRCEAKKAACGADLEKWDFKEYPSDFVVINLGTNDTAAIFLSDRPEEEEAAFAADYRRFIEKIRALNGPETEIICALGNLNYYTYSIIEKAVAEYREKTKDEHIACFKYPFRSFAEPEGACGHPHWVSQVKMAEALAKWIRQTYTGTAAGPEKRENED